MGGLQVGAGGQGSVQTLAVSVSDQKPQELLKLNGIEILSEPCSLGPLEPGGAVGVTLLQLCRRAESREMEAWGERVSGTFPSQF